MMTRKIVDYKIIKEIFFADLETLVCEYIALGWQPYGELRLFQNDPESEQPSWFYQVMVKYEEVDNGK